jgi:LmbE family N-acetylglucosaminyl deacetylase
MDEIAGRLLVIAPHPDDEVIGAGALIQRVVQNGGEVRVVFLTDGERNSWPQRYRYRKWFITDADREQWGATRRTEALSSLETLGLHPADVVFLHWPDQKLSRLARRGNTDAIEALRSEVSSFRPSLMVVSSAQDLHADHRAAAWFAHHAMRGLEERAPEIVTYVVHGEGKLSRIHATLTLSEKERETKRLAIGCHESQLLLSRERFLAYARPTEVFYGPEFDLVCVESRVRERFGAVRHSCRVLLGRSNPAEE